MESEMQKSHNIRNHNGSIFFNLYITDPIGIFKAREHFNHFHVNPEIVAIEHGEGFIYTPKRAIRVKAGDAVIIRSMEPHLFSSVDIKNPLVVSTINFSPRKILIDAEEFISPAVMKIFTYENDINALLDGESNIGKSVARGIFKIKDGLISSICDLYSLKVEFLKIISILCTEFGKNIYQGVSDKYIRLISNSVEYINNNLTSEISLADIAHNSNMEISHFSKIFKEVQGLSPWKFVIYARVELATVYLKDSTSDYSIIEICEMCGFNNLSNFNKLFKSVTGMTPSEFRKWNIYSH